MVQGSNRYCNGTEITAETRIGTNVKLEHGGKGVVVHSDAIIGEGVVVYHQVTIGGYGVLIGTREKIGANAVVLKDVPLNATAVEVPARILIDKGKKRNYSI